MSVLKPLSGRRYNALMRLMELYDREAQRSLKAKAYHAACVFRAALLESVMLAICSIYADELDQEEILAGKPTELINWNLGQLIAATTRAGWLPKRRTKYSRRKIGEWVDIVRKIRNTLHPGNYLRNRPHIRISRYDYDVIDEVVSAAMEHLGAKVEGDLVKQMKYHHYRGPRKHKTK